MEKMGSKRWVAYTIRSRGERSFWIRIGVAFVNQDGSLNLYLDAMPLDGKLQLREARDTPDAEGVPTTRLANGNGAQGSVEA